MIRTEYERYLQGSHWQEFRNYVIRLHPSCQRCRMSREMALEHLGQDLNVHHRHYKTLGCESLQDVEVLCRRCHEEETFHGQFWVNLGEMYADMQATKAGR